MLPQCQVSQRSWLLAAVHVILRGVLVPMESLTLTGSTRLVATRSQMLRFRSIFLPCANVQMVLAETITCITRADISNPGFRTSRKQQRAGHHRSRMAELWISIRFVRVCNLRLPGQEGCEDKRSVNFRGP